MAWVALSQSPYENILIYMLFFIFISSYCDDEIKMKSGEDQALGVVSTIPPGRLRARPILPVSLSLFEFSSKQCLFQRKQELFYAKPFAFKF